MKILKIYLFILGLKNFKFYKENYFKLVNNLENLSRLGVDREYFKELEEILRKWKKDFSSTNYNINLEDNPIFNKYFDLYVELSELKKECKNKFKYLE
jgi:hypothetical protein